MAGKTAANTPDIEVSEADLDAADAFFSEAGVEATDDDFAEADDLLNSVEEDDSEGWNPSEKGEGVSGVIVKVGETKSDFAKPGENPMVPTVTINGFHVSAEGEKTKGKYRIIGFGAVLHREIQDEIDAGRCVVGNLMAAKYFGEKPIKRGQFAGKNYRHYTVACMSRKS